MSNPFGMRTEIPKRRWKAFNGAKTTVLVDDKQLLGLGMKTQPVAEMDRKDGPEPWPLAAAATVMVVVSILLWIAIAMGIIALF